MTAFAWNIPAAEDYTIGANIADDQLAAINYIVTANQGGSGAFWQVASYQSTSPRYVVLKRKDGGVGRYIFFGQQGSTPNAAAVSGTPLASALYNGYSPSSTSDTPDTSWLSGAPFSASDYMPGFRCLGATAAGTNRVNYAESSDSIYMLFSSASNGMNIAAAGKLIQDIDGNLIDAVQGSGSSGSTSWATAVSTSGSLFPANVSASYTATDAGLLVRVDGVNLFAFRAIALASNVAARLLNPAILRAYFYQIPIVLQSGNNAYNALGKLRQVAFGPNCNRETRYSSGGINVYGHQQTVDASPGSPGFWFVDIEV